MSPTPGGYALEVGHARLVADVLDQAAATRAAGSYQLLPSLTLARMSPAPLSYQLVDADVVYPCPACRSWAVTVELAGLPGLEHALAVEEALVGHAAGCPPLIDLALEVGARWPR